MRLWELYQKRGLSFPAAVVDANHSNSDKKYKEQPRIVSEVLHSRSRSPELKALVKGVMIESYLEEGCQPIEGERGLRQVHHRPPAWAGRTQSACCWKMAERV